MTLTKNLFFRSAGRFVLTALAALSVGESMAHSVWIESPDGKLLVVRFGEVGEEYEKSPGRLDKLKLPDAVFAPKAADEMASSFVVEKSAEYFLLKNAVPSKAAVITTMFPVMEKAATADKPASARWPQFYARWHVVGSAVVPVSALDIVPATEPGKATVYFKGKPLPGTELTLIHPGGEETELKSDAEGVVKFTAKGKGLHVLSVAGHSESATGAHEGKNYTVVSHNASLSWNE